MPTLAARENMNNIRRLVVWSMIVTLAKNRIYNQSNRRTSTAYRHGGSGLAIASGESARRQTKKKRIVEK